MLLLSEGTRGAKKHRQRQRGLRSIKQDRGRTEKCSGLGGRGEEPLGGWLKTGRHWERWASRSAQALTVMEGMRGMRFGPSQ